MTPAHDARGDDRHVGMIDFAVVAVLAVGAVGAALWTQHRMDMLPCPWCILQRLIFLVIAALALFGAATIAATRGAARLSLRRSIAAAVAVAAWLGIAAALWQYFVAASSVSCDQSLADRIIGALGVDARWPDIFAPWASCADAKAHLFGVRYEAWSISAFGVLSALALRLTRRR